MTDLVTHIPGIDSFNPIRAERMRPLTAFRAFRRLVRDKEDTTQLGEAAFKGLKIVNFESTKLLSVCRGYQRKHLSLLWKIYNFLFIRIRTYIAKKGVFIEFVFGCLPLFFPYFLCLS